MKLITHYRFNMKIYLINTLGGLKPANDSDFEIKQKLKLGEVYSCEIKQARNYQFHKKFFALIKVGHENTQLDMPFDAYRKYIIIKAGYADIYQTAKGAFVVAQSISFGKMTEETFQELYSRCLDKIILDINADKYFIENELINFL